MAKRYEELEFTDNFMFVKIMSTHLDLCADLVGLILNKKIRWLEPVIYENTFQPLYESRGIRFDVYAEDDENTRYDVEMQVEFDASVSRRSRYYHSAMDGKTTLDDGTCTVFVNAGCESFSDYGISDELRDLLDFIRTGNTDGSLDSLAGKLQSAVAEAIQSGIWSTEYMRWEDELKHREFIARKEGREEGLEEGLEKGREEGLAMGREEERAHTEAERKRADDLAAEVEKLKAELAKLIKE